MTNHLFCPDCRHEESPGSLFCSRCGARLIFTCPECGTSNALEARFCHQCGIPLNQAVAVESAEDLPPAEEAERRQLTVFFCDLVGSTALSERLDPEDLRRIVREYQLVCEKVINRYEGHIAQYLGDGILAYFGFPVAHEDDAHRALRSALGILEGMKNLNQHLEQEQLPALSVRIGVHSGMVVVGDMGGEEKREQLALGEAPNLAARLQGLADSDTVVISGATLHLIEGYFHAQSMGMKQLKGIGHPVEVYRVLHESGAHSRLEVAAVKGLTPLVGRELETDLLKKRWQQAKEGNGQIVLISGEAGIGKSRLVHALEKWVAQDPDAWLLEGQCSAYYQNSAFYPVIEMLEQRVLYFKAATPPATKLARVEGFLKQYGFPLNENVPLLAGFLSIPLTGEYMPSSLSPKAQKQRTMAILCQILFKLAARQPVLFVAEDLHWADPSSLEWLSMIIDQASAHPLMLVLTFRPQFNPPWGQIPALTFLTINRLDEKAVKEISHFICRQKALPEQVQAQIVAKTDGVPLFVEELTRMIIESGLLREKEDRYELNGALPPLAIPSTLHDSLTARLDKLAPIKEVAQVGAVLGREFSYEWLAAVLELPENQLLHCLDQLVAAQILLQRGFPPQATYIFRHALLEDTAYDSLLKSRRQQLHQRVAAVISDQFPEMVRTKPEILAHHYTAAGLMEEAVPCWYQAGLLAAARYANLEAIQHLKKGLQLLESASPSPQSTPQKLRFLLALINPCINTKGWGSSEVGEICQIAYRLTGEMENSVEKCYILFSLYAYYLVSGQIKSAEIIRQELNQVAEALNEEVPLLLARWVEGATLFYKGAFRKFVESQDAFLRIYDPEKHGYLIFLGHGDLGIHMMVYYTAALVILGYPDRAKEWLLKAKAWAVQVDKPYAWFFYYWCLQWTGMLRRDSSAVREAGGLTVKLAREKGEPLWLVFGEFYIAQGLALEDQLENPGAFYEMLETSKKAGMKTHLWYPSVSTAEIHLKLGQIEEGLKTVEESFRLAQEGGFHLEDSELFRIKSKLLLRQGKNAEAEQCLRQALETARSQEAKWFELRAAVELAVLWQSQERTQEAFGLLKPVFHWFTEGFDTPDLQEAAGLLEQLEKVKNDKHKLKSA